MAKRPSMRGMGADAFFAPPADAATHRQDSVPASQQAGTPASQLVKATFYLTPELVLKLEQIRFDRLQRGERVDKSALVREAIDRLAS